MWWFWQLLMYAAISGLIGTIIFVYSAVVWLVLPWAWRRNVELYREIRNR